MKLKYFAWVRERIGKSEEDIEIPQNVSCVRELLLWLKSRDEAYAQALQYPEAIRVAIDHEHVAHDQKIADAHEIALFPPMTGG